MNLAVWLPWLNYQGPLELFTMHMCFLGNANVYRYSFEWLEKNMPLVRQTHQAMTHREGNIPCITRLLATAMQISQGPQS